MLVEEALSSIPFEFQEKISNQIVSSLDQWRDAQEALSEAIRTAVRPAVS